MAPLGEHGGVGGPLSGTMRESEILFYQETVLIGVSGSYVKESFRNGHLSSCEPHWGNVEGVGFV